MPQAVHGQNVGREERTEQYTRWSGAQSVDQDGAVKQASDGMSAAVVEQEVNAIRQHLQVGVAKVRLDISDKPTVAAIKALLTPEELAKVQFGSEEHPTA